MCLFPNLLIHPILSSPLASIHVFSMSVSISALEIRSSVPAFFFFFQIPHICVNIQYLSCHTGMIERGGSQQCQVLDSSGARRTKKQLVEVKKL